MPKKKMPEPKVTQLLVLVERAAPPLECQATQLLVQVERTAPPIECQATQLLLQVGRTAPPNVLNLSDLRLMGKFRERQNYIGAPGCTLDDATFVPPPVDQMNVALDAFEKFLHSDDPLPPLIRLGCIHYQFETIHPFMDGNGRLGRLLVTLLLNDWQLLPVPLLYLSAYFERHRDAYYDRLQAVSERGEWPAWLLFFLRGVAEQSQEALTKAKQLQDLQYRWHQAVIHARSSALLFRMIDNLFQSPIITIPEAARLLDVTWRSAKLTIQKLVEAKILTPRDDAKYGKTYIALDIIRIVED